MWLRRSVEGRRDRRTATSERGGIEQTVIAALTIKSTVMNKFYGPVVALLAILLSSGVARAETPGTTENVSVSMFAFNCANFDGRVSYFFFGEPVGTKHPLTLSKDHGGAYTFSLVKPPGHYQLWLESSRPTRPNSIPCETQEWFTVLPGHARHLAMILGSEFYAHSECSVAGTLPAEGFGVSLVLLKGHRIADTVTGGWLGPTQEDINRVAVVDGSAYYIEHVAQGNYVLRFGGVQIPLNVTNSVAPDSPYCQGEFIHNITKEELERAFPPSMMTE